MLEHVVAPKHFAKLFLTDTPFLDVRAEVEFAKGGFPTAKNIPILNDDERQLVGTCYKQKGREAAVEMGHKLVAGETKDLRIQAWCDFAKANANTHMYCWRGGMRSNFARQWMHEAGVDVPLIDGGFKALRRILIDTIDRTAAEVPIIRIGGKTGTRKTALVNDIDFSIDLEGHANHRGSSFGYRVSGVPAQIDFENALGIDLLRKRNAFQDRTLIVEDESQSIGPSTIPKDFYDKMRAADVAIVEMPVAVRVQCILREYVIEMTQEFLAAHPDNGWELYVDYLTQSLMRVKRRLGQERYDKISGLMNAALKKQEEQGDTSDHEGWIIELLADYYDPMCEYQLGKQADKIIYRGSYDEVLEWAKERSLL
jgi:tRNA 2-selenouridine synthase